MTGSIDKLLLVAPAVIALTLVISGWINAVYGSSVIFANNKSSFPIVGKSGFKVGLPIEAPISTKNYYPSGVRSTIKRVRSGGCTAPKKKGSIYNYSLTQPGINGWGSVPRMNY